MDLLELFGSGDSDTSGKCCSGLGDLKENWFKVGVQTKPSKLQCMNIQGKYDTWMICDVSPQRLMEVRAKLTISIIKASLRKKGFYNVNIFLPGATDLNDWSWKDQEEWPGLCKSGKKQSPIDLDRGRAEIVDYLSIRFAFSRAVDATSRWDGHEMSINGDFGKIYLRKEIGMVSYMVSKVVFKFPSEHSIMNNYGGEIQVHCTGETGDFAIMSFFLEQVEGTTPPPNNQFLDNIKWERWRQDVQDPISLVDDDEKSDPGENVKADRVPSLDYLIVQEVSSTDTKLGAESPKYWTLPDIFRKSFFMYTGSTSTPPCKEGIQRFIFEQPIYVPNSQFFALRNKAYNEDAESDGNARKTHPQGKNRVFYHLDNGIKCAGYSASMSIDNSMNSWDNTQVKENLSVDLSKIKKTWLRASNIMTTYGYTGADVPDFAAYGLDKPDPGARQSIALSTIDPDTVTDTAFPIAKKKLLKEAQKQMKETCKKDSKETYKEMREKYHNSEEAIHVNWFDRRR